MAEKVIKMRELNQWEKDQLSSDPRYEHIKFRSFYFEIDEDGSWFVSGPGGEASVASAKEAMDLVWGIMGVTDEWGICTSEQWETLTLDQQLEVIEKRQQRGIQWLEEMAARFPESEDDDDE